VDQLHSYGVENRAPYTAGTTVYRLAVSVTISACVILLSMGCGSGANLAPNTSLASTTYATSAGSTQQPLIPFTRVDSTQCLGLEDATLRFLDAQSVDEVRRYLMPVVLGKQGLPGTQTIAVETNHLSYEYNAESDILLVHRGAVTDTGNIATINGSSTLSLQEHFQSVTYCSQTAPISIIYHRM
jgi:hypothetical protein